VRVLLAVLAVLAVLASSVLVVPTAAADDDQTRDCSEIADEDAGHYSTDQPSLPLQEMGVDHAWARLKQQHIKPGQGVTVAVIDSGVADNAPITIAGQRVDAGNKIRQPQDYHGTAVAGLIAGHVRRGGGGPVGIAPYAKVFDVQVYDEAGASTAPDSTESPMTVENLREGLDAVIAAVPTLGITIVNVSLAIPDDDQVREKIAQLTALGAVVVAPTGNRSSSGLPGDVPSAFATPRPGEDAAPYVHPADYDGVLGVSVTPAGSTNPDPTHWALENSMTDVAAPSAGAVSYSLRGESCVLTDPATSYATAEVSGVLALLQSAYDESVSASVRRLLTTANGRPDIPNPLVGAGEVQAMDALTRPMDIEPNGTDLGAGSVEHQPQVLTVPEEPEDVLASTRGNAVWWGLVGGGVLLLAVVLRPVLARRRRTVRQ
jgi:membrane-anchored mycosin MYCP